MNFSHEKYSDATMFKSIIFSPIAYKKDNSWQLQDALIYEIDDNGILHLNNQSLNELCNVAKEEFAQEQEAKRVSRELEEAERAERLKQLLEEEEKRKERQRQQEAESEKRRAELAEERRIERERRERERLEREEAFKAALKDNFANQDEPIIDADGKRWFKCELCGKIALESEFWSYGGSRKANIGNCYDCLRNNPTVHEKTIQQNQAKKMKYDPNICPECGGRLREKNGRLGWFMGCSNYPDCRYTRRIYRK